MANLLGGCTDRANIGMKGAVYAKRGTTFDSRLGHQRVAPGENPVRLAYSLAMEEQQKRKYCLSA